MDIVGVSEVTAEAELLSAVVSFFESVGISSKDVGRRAVEVINSISNNFSFRKYTYGMN